MRPVVLIGSSCDVTFNHVVARSREEGLTSKIIWMEDYLSKGSGRMDLRSGNIHIYLGKAKRCEISPEASVYCRLYDYHLSTLPTNQKRRRSERMYQLQSMLQRSAAKVVPRPFNDGLNTSKPRQTLALSRAGFRVPRSLVTNSPKLARQFIKDCDAAVIYKSTSSERSIVSKISDEKLRILDRIRFCPVFFQECIEGFDVRLHVVGGDAYAEQIEAPTVDYRYASPGSRIFSRHQVPSDVFDRAVAFMREQDLNFAGFDFKVSRASGEYYCLEANPNPGFEGYDFRAGGKISKALFEIINL